MSLCGACAICPSWPATSGSCSPKRASSVLAAARPASSFPGSIAPADDQAAGGDDRPVGAALLRHEVAALFRVGWDTVKQIHHRALATRLGPLEGDRFAGCAAHRDRRVCDPQRADAMRASWSTSRPSGCCGWRAAGRRRPSTASSRRLGPAGCARLEAVVLDLAIPYLTRSAPLSAGPDRL